MTRGIGEKVRSSFFLDSFIHDRVAERLDRRSWVYRYGLRKQTWSAFALGLRTTVRFSASERRMYVRAMGIGPQLNPLNRYDPKRAGSNTISASNTHGGGHEHWPLEALLLLEEAFFARSDGSTDTVFRIVVPRIAAFEVHVSVFAWHPHTYYIKS